MKTVSGPIDDAAQELADEAFQYLRAQANSLAQEITDTAFDTFKARVENEIPLILAQNDQKLREIATEAVTEGARNANLGELIGGAADQVKSALIWSSVATVLGAAIATAIVIKVMKLWKTIPKEQSLAQKTLMQKRFGSLGKK